MYIYSERKRNTITVFEKIQKLRVYITQYNRKAFVKYFHIFIEKIL